MMALVLACGRRDRTTDPCVRKPCAPWCGALPSHMPNSTHPGGRMKRLLFVVFLALGTTACGREIQSIRKPPAMSIVLFTLAAGATLLRRKVTDIEHA